MPQRTWDDWGYYPQTHARPVKDGIKAKSQRGAIGESWWSKRWVEVLESFDIGARLSRGRSYARRGQVISISVEPGKVKAQVQGSMPRPYAISIELTTLSSAEWERVVDIMASRAVFARETAGRRNAHQYRGSIQRRACVALPYTLQRPGDGLLLSRLVKPL